MSQPTLFLRTAERDLLFAIFALQMDLAGPEAVLAGLHVWLTEPDQALGLILVEQQALSAEERNRLDLLVADALDRQSRSDGTMFCRAALRRFIDLCRALDYAALRRPSPMPRPVVAGLPTDLGRVVALVRGRLDTDNPLPWSNTSVFLCPEQNEQGAAPAAYVYGLGIVLYGLMTGKPPFEEDESAAVAERMQRGDFWPPRTLRPSIPMALEAICMKAMAPVPGHRYSSPTALAADIDHWLADEPITACPETMTRRLARWGHRHQTLAAAAAVGLIGVAVGLAVALVLIYQDRQRLSQANASLVEENADSRVTLGTERAARSDADAHWLEARDQLAAQSEEVMQDWLGNRPVLTPPQRKYLENALAYYQHCLSPGAPDQTSRASHADAWFQMGLLLQRLGSGPDAERAFQNSERILTEMVKQHQADFFLRQEQANGHLYLAALEAAKTPALAEKQYREGVRLHKQLGADFPQLSDLLSTLAASQRTFALFLANSRRPVEAAKTLQEAIAVQKRLVKNVPKSSRYRRELARLYVDLAQMQDVKANSTEAPPSPKSHKPINRSLPQSH
jgi:eukaryotic-like serine/threonine-protein kinase